MKAFTKVSGEICLQVRTRTDRQLTNQISHFLKFDLYEWRIRGPVYGRVWSTIIERVKNALTVRGE